MNTLNNKPKWEGKDIIRHTEDYVKDLHKAMEKHGHKQKSETIKVAVKRYANEETIS